MSDNFAIERLGQAKIQSPIHLGTERGDLLADFVPDDSRVLADIELAPVLEHLRGGSEPPWLELAGPRESIYFDPTKLKVGIVTCGGICPGLNNVVRGLVMTLHHGYGLQSIYGFRYGYSGLNPDSCAGALELTPELVRDIHHQGGTVLGTSRGPQDPTVMVDCLDRMNIRLLFAIGGDGTFRGAMAVHEEVRKRGLKLAVIGIPKTIDNDIPRVDFTFGFQTAVDRAAEAIRAAYFEAISARNGIGLVKLMGRHSGFIAANATLASRNVNLVLVPELPFELDGDRGLFAHIERRFAAGKSTVIVVAEGAGQELLRSAAGADLSGNVSLGDIGVFLKERINERFKGKLDFTLKYIDPSYTIRSAPANSSDAIYCGYLAQAAAHAGMTGRTGMAVGRSHNRFTHIPLELLTSGRKQIDPEGDLWLSVLASTGQPFYMTSRAPKDLARMSFVPHM